MMLKKVIIFNDKQFYNARHLHDHLEKNYSLIHKVTYLQVREATGKRLKSIDKYYKVSYEMISKSQKAKLKRWMQISEGYEKIVAFETLKVYDFIIKYLGQIDVSYLFTYRNIRDELILAFKHNALINLIQKYNKELWGQLSKNIIESSTAREGYYFYHLQPSSIKQNIF